MKKKSYSYIIELVFDIIHQTKGLVDYDTVTSEVKKRFPKSKWQKSHWAWYRTQIKTGRYKHLFSEEERENLAKSNEKRRAGRKIKLKLGKAEPVEEQDDVKRVGDALLNHVRFMVKETAKDDADLRFKLNRWVYSRLMQDEIREKRPIKRKLWEMGMKSCQSCGKKFKTLKGVEIHRINGKIGYSVENCDLLCRPCHQGKGKENNLGTK
jgi:5-methylcytosine-specific restriction endonuclease McrA